MAAEDDGVVLGRGQRNAPDHIDLFRGLIARFDDGALVAAEHQRVLAGDDGDRLGVIVGELGAAAVLADPEIAGFDLGVDIGHVHFKLAAIAVRR